MKIKRSYNNKYLEKIIRILKENRLEEAIVGFKQYIKNYPNDLNGYNYLANTYM